MLTALTDASWSTVKDNSVSPVFTASFGDDNTNALCNTADPSTCPADCSMVDKVYSVPTGDGWSKSEDNITCNGTQTIKNASGRV